MKKNTWHLLFLLLLCSQSPAQWTWQNPHTQGNVLYDIQFTDSLNGWVCGNFGTIIKTEDAGKKWQLLKSPSNGLFLKLFFLNKNKGFICSYERMTFITNDGGLSWDAVKPLNKMYVQGIQFLNEKTGYVLAIDSTYAFQYILKTEDGGITWNSYNRHPVYWLSSAFFFLDENHGWIESGGNINRTIDGGKTWLSTPTPGFRTGIAQMQFIDKSYGFLVGNSINPFNNESYGVFEITSDGGATWSSRDLPDQKANLNSVHFTSNQTGYIAAYGYPYGKVFHTTDAGINWKILDSTVSRFTFSGNLKSWGIDAFNIIRSTANGWMSSIEQIPSVTPVILYSVSALDSNNIAAAGQYSTVVLSHNGGRTWERSNSSQNNDVSINSVFYKSNNEIWAVGNNTVLFSTNKGTSWNSFQFDPPNWLSDIAFIDDTTGVILGGRENSGFVYTGKAASVNSTFVWQKTHEFPFSIEKIKFTKSGTGYISGKNKILKTTDRGKTWQSLQIPVETSFLTLEAIDENIWTVAGNNILVSTNSGISWNTYKAFEFPGPYSSFSTVRALSFADKFNGIMGLDGRIVRTYDGGLTWKEDKQITTNFFNSACYVDKDHAWIVGQCGNILNYNSHSTFINNRAFMNIEDYHLDQNYPNPFNPMTTISYSIPKESFVELIIYDMLGRKVLTLVNGQKSTGEHKVQFDGSSLPSGLYIYTLQAGSFRDSKKLLLLK